MIIVVLLFAVGGGFYTLGCKPWDTGELLKVDIETYQPVVFRNIILSNIHKLGSNIFHLFSLLIPNMSLVLCWDWIVTSPTLEPISM